MPEGYVSDRFKPLVEKIEKAFADHSEWTPVADTYIQIVGGRYCFCPLGAGYINESPVKEDAIASLIQEEDDYEVEVKISNWLYDLGYDNGDLRDFVLGFDGKEGRYLKIDAYAAGVYLREKYIKTE